MATSSRSDFTLDRWLAWFETLHPKQIDLGLERLITMLDRLGLRTPRAKVITVAGTNGKGSCVAMLESVYWHAGYRVGVFTSPHLWRFNERVRVDGADAADSELVAAFRSLDAALREVTLSYFEASFVAALWLFARRNVDVIVLEVGMGGRLDATNTIDTDCALIVSIDLDHREFLGDTREEIGREKAGIVRPGKPVVVADRAVPASVLAHAAAVGATPRLLGRDFDFRRDGRRWRRHDDPITAPTLPLPAFGGDEQFANAAACAAVVRSLSAERPVPEEALALGLERAYLRGRLERQDVDGVQWVFDVGHNPAAAAGLAASVGRLPPAARTWVLFAAMRDKDLAGVVQPFVASAAGWVVTRVSPDRGATGEELEALLESLDAAPAVTAPSIEVACERLRVLTSPGDRVVVYGSFHTVGAAMEALQLYSAASPMVDRPATWIRV